MPNYDLRVLDDKEFEALAADLLGVVYGCRIERFKPGKDAGVDGRWFIREDREAIIQCKHWMRSGYSRLVKHLSTVEKPKIEKLNPERYILVTSVELSRKNKRQIRRMLAPHIKSESDIVGREDLDDLLAKHPEVERRHYKLWLSSASVLNHIIHNDIFGRSGFDITEIREKAPRVVKTSDFDRAAHVLNTLHTVLITGVPGIGKTTLAEQLVVKLLADGYELVSLRSITDGESVFHPTRRQVFYFDDFLGRNLLEAIKLQHDSQIVGFIRRVFHDKAKRFVLTSRTSILNQGKHFSDLFSLHKTERNEYEVRIEALSRYEKARILYSHIWHSALPNEMLEQLFVDKRYKTIVDHRNFNPRLISFITDNDLTSNVPAEKYWDYIVTTLENPQSLWEHFFAQMTQDCRDMVYLVVLNGRSISEHDLIQAFRRLKETALHDAGAVEDRARVALRICTGSVLNRKISDKSDLAKYDLYNPSIGDYVIGRLAGWSTIENHVSALGTTASLWNLSTMKASKVIGSETYTETLDKLALTNTQASADEYSITLSNLLMDDESLVKKHEQLVRRLLDKLDIDSFTGGDELLLAMYTSAIKLGLVRDPNRRILELCARVRDWMLGPDEFGLLADLVSLASGSDQQVAIKAAKQSIISYWSDDYLKDYVSDMELLRDVYGPEDYQNGIHEVEDAVTVALKETGFVFTASEVTWICDTLDMDSIAERNIERQHDASVYEAPPQRPSNGVSEDRLIEDLFDRELPDSN
jgi:hypothetical protein